MITLQFPHLDPRKFYDQWIVKKIACYCVITKSLSLNHYPKGSNNDKAFLANPLHCKHVNKSILDVVNHHLFSYFLFLRGLRKKWLVNIKLLTLQRNLTNEYYMLHSSRDRKILWSINKASSVIRCSPSLIKLRHAPALLSVHYL